MGSLETLSHLETVSRQHFHCLGLCLGLEPHCLGLGLGLGTYCLAPITVNILKGMSPELRGEHSEVDKLVRFVSPASSADAERS
jgi:hypothetical protein